MSPTFDVAQLHRLALVVVDVQQGFDDEAYWGRRDNHRCEENVQLLLEAWRDRGRPVVLVRHDSDDAASPLHRTSPGNALRRSSTVPTTCW